MKKETADSICGNTRPDQPCKPIVVGFPPINEDGFIKSHPERPTQLHSNKRGREDCADCPYPERSCDECISGARSVSSKSPEPAGEFVAKWRELYKRRTNMGDDVTLSWTDILKALACIERLGNERLVEVGQLKLDIISLQNKLAEARKALKKHGQHIHCDCCAILVESKGKGRGRYPAPCNCGLDQALKGE
ncbi:hypothetical protein LCGC14_1059560 [marine sediment metagenome]|uniref:Uncharacterized protein n=1 Tax=marine sediment metagenome TaxID=412755 RepID=A0A0F9MR49_9ZZZZ